MAPEALTALSCHHDPDRRANSPQVRTRPVALNTREPPSGRPSSPDQQNGPLHTSHQGVVADIGAYELVREVKDLVARAPQDSD